MNKQLVVSMWIAGYLYAAFLFLQNERVFFLGLWVNLIIGLLLAGGSAVILLLHRRNSPEEVPAVIANEPVQEEIAAVLEPAIETADNMETSLIEQTKDSLCQIVTALEEVTIGSENQSHSSAELAAAMQKFAENIMMVALKGEDAKRVAAEMHALTKEGASHMEDSVFHMNTIADKITFSFDKVRGLNDKTDQISTLLKTIKEIAEQTNLLALNAAIEAARAGDQGRGFAVVADEVRKLSDQVRIAVSDITSVFQAIQTESKAAVEALGEGNTAAAAGSEKVVTTQRTFAELQNEILITSEQVEEIAAAMYEVLDNTRGITDSINSIVTVAEQNAASMQEVTAITQDIQQKFYQ
ncbi:methyl-accepting chemotaxis protein [Terribacillus aidingensis]|uniref:Methyl-accepting chemotaxis protein n=1 Tax=Terribacillus aidingensis TaxID=586416 RepID=A0A285NCH7_9BACI|nr:methyl-accepting chemotaxis protein [Terribacillus aidingensis]SNZ05646.1 methyl-accepting chemotaxis protein [Terribacillus aidingensis]